LPREVEVSELEKVERVRPTWTQKAGGFALGDAVQFKPEWLRSMGQIASEAAHLRGRIVEFKGEGAVARAMIEWSNGHKHTVLVGNLAKVKSRETGK
jgi:hypothetical protein